MSQNDKQLGAVFDDFEDNVVALTDLTTDIYADVLPHSGIVNILDTYVFFIETYNILRDPTEELKLCQNGKVTGVSKENPTIADIVKERMTTRRNAYVQPLLSADYALLDIVLENMEALKNDEMLVASARNLRYGMRALAGNNKAEDIPPWAVKNNVKQKGIARTVDLIVAIAEQALCIDMRKNKLSAAVIGQFWKNHETPIKYVTGYAEELKL